jgi:hypothetical protein
MSYSLEDALRSFNDTTGSEPSKDVTLLLDNQYTGPDRRIAKGTLHYTNDETECLLELVIGFRSDIMDGFSKFEVLADKFLPCDIIGMVPGFASFVSLGKKVEWDEVRGEDSHQLLLELRFKGVPSKKDSLHSLTIVLERFMDNWTRWTQVLLNILTKDSVIQATHLDPDDIRELLLGESGFYTMPWFSFDLNLVDRARILDRIQEASHALLISVLTTGQLQEPIIQELMEWLNGLSPLPVIHGSHTQIGEEVV